MKSMYASFSLHYVHHDSLDLYQQLSIRGHLLRGPRSVNEDVTEDKRKGSAR
jgi:hypothetical protein